MCHVGVLGHGHVNLWGRPGRRGFDGLGDDDCGGMTLPSADGVRERRGARRTQSGHWRRTARGVAIPLGIPCMGINERFNNLSRDMYADFIDEYRASKDGILPIGRICMFKNQLHLSIAGSLACDLAITPRVQRNHCTRRALARWSLLCLILNIAV